MRHMKAGRRLGRTTAHRQALLSNLVTALIEHEQIRTTLPKAKEARRLAEKMISFAKRSDLHHRRLAARTIRDREALQKLFATLGPRFATRNGGYTRVLRLGRRLGDGAPMALLEWTDRAAPAEAGGTDAEGAGAKTETKAAARKAKAEAKAAAPKKKASAAKPEGKAKIAPEAKASAAPKKKAAASTPEAAGRKGKKSEK